MLSYNSGDSDGMKGFYDGIVPKNLRNLLRKLVRVDGYVGFHDTPFIPPERVATDGAAAPRKPTSLGRTPASEEIAALPQRWNQWRAR